MAQLANKQARDFMELTEEAVVVPGMGRGEN